MKILIIIGAGSFIGGVSRYLLSEIIQTRLRSAFPFGTWAVNILGCFLIGFVFGLASRTNLTKEFQLFIATGMLGGFTTFSAFSNETVILFRNGQIGYAFIYILASVLLGLFATFIGYLICN